MRSFPGIIFLALFPFVACFCQSGKPLMSVPPAWITLYTIDYSSTALDKEAENGSVDLDYEEQINLNDQSVYTKHSIKILSEAGVQDNSEVTIDFDPTYQQLIIHTIEIIRDGESVNKLNLGKLKIIHVEKDLDKFIYDGQLEATLILDDVRKNDIIEYSYTLKGFNPIFQNKFQRFFDTKLDIPVYNLYYKLIVPINRSINIKNNNDTINPLKHTEGNNNIYEWRKINNHTIRVQDKLPDWYDPYSSIMISEFNSWSEVNNWAKQLFPENISISPALKNEINKINSNYKTSEEKTTAAMRFVQDDIRYMGIEMGIHSHKPANPNKVFDQRFGDCKEKSYLLCVMLNSIGINACPVLINASYKKTITEWLPAAIDFDHCTVRVIINNKTYWLDPTISYQRGSLSTISYPDYQFGLVLTDTTTSLSTIKPQGKNKETVKEIFTVPEYYGLCYFKVITTYSGAYADDTRSDFNYSSDYEMQKNYLNFYKDYFDNIKSDSLTYSDNDSTGIFTTTEYYSIDSFWTIKDNSRTADFSCYVISDLLKKPKETNRTMPIGLSFPVHCTEELDINLAGNGWNLKEVDEDVRCASFAFIKKSKVYDNRIIIDYDYERFKDNVMPEESGNYLSALQKINEEQDYQISWNDDNKSATSSTSSTGTLVEIIIVILVLLGLIVRWTQRR
ncbi:MAG: DUF3857 domain-containing protein [Parafilimonas sp.]